MLTNLYLLSVFGHTQVSPFFLICIPGQDSQTDRATVSGKDKLRLMPQAREAVVMVVGYFKFKANLENLVKDCLKSIII